VERKNDSINPSVKTKELTDPKRRKALIVDDETDICYLLSNILKQKNIQTSFAGSLSEADKMLQSPITSTMSSLTITYLTGWE
jgi:DNA-binding NtrC family response regulator